MASVVNAHFKRRMAMADVDFSNDSFNVALYTDSYTPSADATAYSTTHEVISSGTNYPSGGVTLSEVTLTTSTSMDTNYVRIDASDISFPSANFTFRYAVIYNTTRSNFIVGVIDFGQNVTANNQDLVIRWSSNGILRIA